MILHIPHSSKTIPEKLRDQIVLSDEELADELNLMTDAFTDELFDLPGATVVRFPLSRLIVDVERFPDDAEEPMSKVGMGKFYTQTSHGHRLRRRLDRLETELLLAEVYRPHHDYFTEVTTRALHQDGKALILDAHSLSLIHI